MSGQTKMAIWGRFMVIMCVLPDYEGGYIDQIAQAVETIKNNPNSRRSLSVLGTFADLPK
jgi:thymidylate synthase